MSVKDEILKKNPPGSKGWSDKDESTQYQKGTQQWSEENTGTDNGMVGYRPKTQQVKTDKNKSQSVQGHMPKGSKGWSDKDESTQYQKGTQQWSEENTGTDNGMEILRDSPKVKNDVSTPKQQEDDKTKSGYNWREDLNNEGGKVSVASYGNGEVGYRPKPQKSESDNKTESEVKNDVSTPKQQEDDKTKSGRTPFEFTKDYLKDSPEVKKTVENVYNNVVSNSTPKQQEKKVSTYVELLEELYPKPDPEKLKKDAKRARTRNIIAALGDGLSALSNLYYTTKGAPNMYDGKTTLSEKSQARYDKLLKDYNDNLEKYRQGRLKALQLDEDRADKDKQWQRLLGRDQVEDERWNKQWQRILERDKAEDKKFDWQKTEKDEDDERERKKADREYNLKSQNQNKGNDKEKEVHYFNDVNKEMAIDAKKWKDNYPRLYNDLVEEGVIVESRGEKPTSDQMETAVKRNWSKSKNVTGQMLSLSDENVGFDEQFEGITIPYNIWINEYEKIFDEMVKDGTAFSDLPNLPNLIKQSLINKMSSDEKEQFIRENWNKSPDAKNHIKKLAGIPYSDDNTAPYIRNQNSDDNTAPYIRK